MVRNLDYDGAFKSVDQFDKESEEPFVAHAVEKILFACGLHALHHKDFKKAETLLTATSLVSHFEKPQEQLIAVLDMEDDWDVVRLTVCENILSVLQKKCSSVRMNPYEVLAIKHDATPHDIVQAAAMALRKKEYTAREIADARNQLMDPEVRMILDFVHHVDVESLIKPGKGTGSADPALSLVDDTVKLERLTVFDSQR